MKKKIKVKKDKIKEFLDEVSTWSDEPLLYPTGFEKAIIGTVERCGTSGPIILVDRDKCIDILVKRDNMTYEDAVDFYEFNIVGAYVGEGTPAFASLIK
jgi:hypothetical protein